MSLSNWRVDPSGPLKWKMEDGKWRMEVCGVWFWVCGVCGVWWWVVVCGNGSGSMDPVTPDVLGSTVADSHYIGYIKYHV